jgi:riboflavin synthase
MFTGLVSELGEVTNILRSPESAIFTISAPALIADIKVGDSISVNGVCLTAISIMQNTFSADVMIQTLNLTSLSIIETGSKVNLELAARVSDRLGGHIVQGHVDGVGTVKSLKPGEKWAQFDVEVPTAISKYIVNQGSIALDGVSLTVGKIDDATSLVTLWLIPETLEQTNLSGKSVGDPINIEVDVLAKYVERLIEKRDK